MPRQNKVILFNGPPGSGKDTACRVLANLQHWPIVVEKFAKSVKEGCHGLFGLVDENGAVVPHDAYELVKNKPMKKFMGMSPREAYIWYSEEVMKPKFGKDVFGRLTVARMNAVVARDTEPKLGEFTVRVWGISDSGFVEEAACVVENFGASNVALVRLYREGCDFTNDSRSYLRGLGVPEYDVWNTGTGQDLSDLLHTRLAPILLGNG
jgi:hypothetical protein